MIPDTQPDGFQKSYRICVKLKKEYSKNSIKHVTE